MVQNSKGREHRSSERPWMKWVKFFSHKKDRQTTRQLLYHERYDDIPMNKPANTEDSWGWD